MNTNIILYAIAVISLVGLVLHLCQSFKRVKPVDNTEQIAGAVLLIEREIARCTAYTHIESCQAMMQRMLLDKYEVEICNDHVKDLVMKLQVKRIMIQMNLSIVSRKSIIRELDAEECAFLIQTLPISETEAILLCMVQYKQITGNEYEL